MSNLFQVCRSINDHDLFWTRDGRCRIDRYAAWMWMIGTARWKTNGIGRGQLHCSERVLAKKFFGGSRKKAEIFRGHLERHNMVFWEPQSGPQGSLVTICNYEKYQTLGSMDEPVKEPLEEKKGATKGAQKENQRKPERKNTVKSDFDQWWEHYPKKVGKGHARRAFTTALKKTSLENLIAAVRAKRGGLSAEPQFRPYPATWLNGECWADEEQPRRSDVVVPYRFGVR